MSLAIAILGVALADLIAGGLAGQPRSLNRTLLAVAVSAVLSIVLIVQTAGTSAPAQALLLVATLLFWTLGRFLGEQLHPGLPLLALATGLASIFLAGTRTQLEQPDWLASLPYEAIRDSSLESLLLIFACLVFLIGTSNSIVRAILLLAGTPIDTSSSRLRGGRIIGTLERVLIFGLALAGEPTAAALVASAKSILRFPELSKLAREEHSGVDELTEYFLVGSLASWTLALIMAAIVRVLA